MSGYDLTDRQVGCLVWACLILTLLLILVLVAWHPWGP